MPDAGSFAAPQMARIKAQALAEEAFVDAETRFAHGLSFEEAKRAALEERVPKILAEHGEEVADEVIHAVMGVPASATHPKAREAHRRRRWRALCEANKAAGGAPPTLLERKLFDWLGMVPKRLRR